jgi:serine palmitoyltransferase
VVDELCAEWEPEPLAGTVELEPEMEFPLPPLVDSYNAPYVGIDGKKVVDFSSFGFLGMACNEKVKESAKATVRKYGVGSCGPRGFYGTFDVHLQAERDLADFYGTDEAIVFSSGYATISSCIPAFAKRGDLLICDKGISHALLTGILLSRSNTYWFKHNDVEDLERVLLEVEKYQKSKGMSLDAPPVRKFLIIEGLYPNYGDIAPVKKYLELKERHCFRIIMDDSFGLGVRKFYIF